MLAIVLNHYDCASVLLEHGANANTETDGWSGMLKNSYTQVERSSQQISFEMLRKNTRFHFSPILFCIFVRFQLCKKPPLLEIEI